MRKKIKKKRDGEERKVRQRREREEGRKEEEIYEFI